MELSLALNTLREQHERLLTEYDRVLREVQDIDVLRENKELRQNIDETAALCKALEMQYRQVSQENLQLKLSLQEQMLDEKLLIIKISREKLRAYFADATKEHADRLSTAEAQVKQKVTELKKASYREIDGEMETIIHDLSIYENTIMQILCARNDQFNAGLAAHAEENTRQLDELAAEPISPEVAQKRIKQNELEMKVGLNWVNKLGVLLILLGVGTAAQYTYSTWFNDSMRGAGIFALGGLFLLGGEWFYRKDKDVFATGLLGGGISIIYCGIFYSYFLLKIIGLDAGIGLSVLTTATSVILSVRYRSQTICALGLVGGYLPFFTYIAAFGLHGNSYYAAMGYLFALNFSVMLVSFHQRWSIIHYVSMVLHIPSLFYLSFGAADKPIAIMYSAASFSTYLGVILAYPLKYRQSLRRVDVILLGANTLLSCAILYLLFKQAAWGDFQGLLAMGFCLVYAALARLVTRRMPEERYALGLFYATALTFAILMVPFQFGVRWTSMGLLVEGVILVLYGLKKNEARLEKSGLLIFGLCIGAFYLFDWLRFLAHHATPFFEFKYFFVITGMVGISGLYLLDLQKNGFARYGKNWVRIHWFKYFAIFNVWIYLMHIGGHLLRQLMAPGYYQRFYYLLLIAGITMALAYLLPRWSLVRDKAVVRISQLFYALSVVLVLGINLVLPAVRNISHGTAEEYVALAVLIAYNLMMFGIVREIARHLIQSQYRSYEVYPMALLLFGLGDVTLFLARQFHFGSTNLTFSLMYLLVGLTAIHYGFRHKYANVRRTGLALSLLATTKLFIYDLTFLTSFNKILAYFCFGFVLLGISFIYQRLKNDKETQTDGENE